MKHCRSCGENNTDDRIFCCACGEPLNADLQLIMDLDKMTKTPRQTEPARTQAVKDDDYVPPRTTQTQKKKKSAAPWIILAVVVIAIIVAVIVL